MKYRVHDSDGSSTVKSRALRKTELKRVRIALANSDLLKLRGKLVSSYQSPANDYIASVVVTIVRRRGLQKLTLVSFEPALGHDFPRGVRELLCLIDELRHDREHLTSNCAPDSTTKTTVR
jgi:hypothetical protein